MLAARSSRPYLVRRRRRRTLLGFLSFVLVIIFAAYALAIAVQHKATLCGHFGSLSCTHY
jgi:hypothetical protein